MVYTYDTKPFSASLKSRRSYKSDTDLSGYMWDEDLDFDYQFDTWASSPNISKKRGTEIKRSSTLYKGPSSKIKTVKHELYGDQIDMNNNFNSVGSSKKDSLTRNNIGQHQKSNSYISFPVYDQITVNGLSPTPPKVPERTYKYRQKQTAEAVRVPPITLEPEVNSDTSDFTNSPDFRLIRSANPPEPPVRHKKYRPRVPFSELNSHNKPSQEPVNAIPMVAKSEPLYKNTVYMVPSHQPQSHTVRMLPSPLVKTIKPNDGTSSLVPYGNHSKYYDVPDSKTQQKLSPRSNTKPHNDFQISNRSAFQPVRPYVPNGKLYQNGSAHALKPYSNGTTKTLPPNFRPGSISNGHVPLASMNGHRPHSVMNGHRPHSAMNGHAHRSGHLSGPLTNGHASGFTSGHLTGPLTNGLNGNIPSSGVTIKEMKVVSSREKAEFFSRNVPAKKKKVSIY